MQSVLKQLRAQPVLLVFIVCCTGLLIYNVWSTPWFITTDGPSHCYNAFLLSEWLFSSDWSQFFGQFMHVFLFPTPNWTGHVFMALLLRVFEVQIAEKVLYTIYVVVYLFSLLKLAKRLKLDTYVLIGFMLPFMFPKTFLTGFVNYQLAFALMPLIMERFIWCLQQFNWQRWSILLVWTLVLYFTHALPYLLAIGAAGLWVLYTWKSNHDEKSIKTGLLTLSAIVPTFILMVMYVLNSHNSASTLGTEEFKGLWHGFLELDSLTHYNTDTEKPWLIALSLFIGLVMLIAVGRIIRKAWFVSEHVFFTMFMLSAIFYFTQPDQFAGAGILSMRTQFIPYIFAIAFIACRPWPRSVSYVIGVSSIGLFACLTFIRYDAKLLASEAIDDLMNVRSHMDAYKTAIGLNCNHNGQLNAETISPSTWLFTHAPDYINTDKKQLSLVNYESILFHFPLKWNEPFDPYAELSCRQGIEHIPPCLNYKEAEEKHGFRVDYVFLVFPHSDKLYEHKNLMLTRAHLSEQFELTYTSPNKIVELYTRIVSPTH